MSPRFRIVVMAAVGLPVVFMIIGSAMITISGLRDNPHAADLAVVPGSKVYPDGRPSEQLQARLDESAKLYREGYFPLILVSGAHGREGYDEPKVMRRYLEAQGVPAGAILEDNEGRTTWLTARDAAQMLHERHLKSVLVISQYFHMARCRLAFGRHGIAPVYSSHAPFWNIRDFYSIPREVIGYVDYALLKPKPLLEPAGPTG